MSEIYDEENREKDAFDQASESVLGTLDSENELAEQNKAEAEQVDQEQAEIDDPRESENWGFKGVVRELQSAVTGGVQDSLSSVATFAERTTDALSGEMQRERQENGYYKPQWDPFQSYSNPIITKTWWGKLARGAVHFGSLAAAIIPAAKVTAARLGVGAAWAGAHSMVRAAGVGAASDLISKESDGDNALGMLRDRYGWIDTPLSTKDTDHPIICLLYTSPSPRDS